MKDVRFEEGKKISLGKIEDVRLTKKSIAVKMLFGFNLFVSKSDHFFLNSH